MYVKKIISLILTVFLLSAYIPAQLGVYIHAQASQSTLLANYSFNSFATNDSPKSLSVSGKDYLIYEYDNKDKGLLLNISRTTNHPPATHKYIKLGHVERSGNANIFTKK